MVSLTFQDAVIEFISINIAIVVDKIQVTLRVTDDQAQAVRRMRSDGVIQAWPGILRIGDETLEDVTMSMYDDKIIFDN